MTDKTPRFDLNTYVQGDENWDHTDTVEAVDKLAIDRGPISGRPASGDYDDQMYFATDQRIMWRWDTDATDWKAAGGLGSSSQAIPGTTHVEALEAGSINTEQGFISSFNADAVVHRVSNGNIVATGNEGEIARTSSNAEDVINSAISHVSDNGGGTVRLKDIFEVSQSVIGAKSVTVDGGHPQKGGFRLADSSDTSVVDIPAGANHFGLKNCYISGNRLNNTAGNGVLVNGYLYKPRLENVIIRDCTNAGIKTQANSNRIFEPYWNSVDVGNCGTGIIVEGCVDIVGVEIYSHDNGYRGVDIYTPGHMWYHVHAFNNVDNGIVVNKNAPENWFWGPYLDTNHKNGMLLDGVERVFVMGCHGFNNSQETAGTYDAIRATDATQCFVAFSVLQDYQSAHTQNIGFNETGSSNENVVFATPGRNNLTGTVSLAGGDSKQEYIF